jgi:hypothetical protein
VNNCGWWYQRRQVMVTDGTRRSHKRHAWPVLTEVPHPVGAFPRLSIPPPREAAGQYTASRHYVSSASAIAIPRALTYGLGLTSQASK